MAKGIYTQGVSLLTDGTIELESVRRALDEGGYQVVKEVPEGESVWFGGHILLVPYKEAVNGYAAIDIVNEPWPDSMGDPTSEFMVLGAWSMGHFGPFAFPYGMKRAGQHAWSWEGGREMQATHKGFIRVRLSYVYGGGDSAPVMPEDCDPINEMFFISGVVDSLLSMPGVLCYFNPNGEVLRDAASFKTELDECVKQKNLPLSLWSNVRFYTLNEKYSLMDTVGNSQLDMNDIEVIFPRSDYEPGDVDYYLRNVTHYLLGLDGELQTGESIDGPGEDNLTWSIVALEEGAITPPRQVIRLHPKACQKEIDELLATE